MKFDDMKKLWMAKPKLIFIMILSVIIKLTPIPAVTWVPARRIQTNLEWKILIKTHYDPAYNTGPDQHCCSPETDETDTNLETNNWTEPASQDLILWSGSHQWKKNDTSLIDLYQISLIHQFRLDSRGEMRNMTSTVWRADLGINWVKIQPH